MEWNVNLSQLTTALFSSWATGHYWASAFFSPEQTNLSCRLDQKYAESWPSFWVLSQLTADCTYSTSTSTCTGARNWHISTYTIVLELLNLSASFLCGCESTLCLPNRNCDQPKDLQHVIPLWPSQVRRGTHSPYARGAVKSADLRSARRKWESGRLPRQRSAGGTVLFVELFFNPSVKWGAVVL